MKRPCRLLFALALLWGAAAGFGATLKVYAPRDVKPPLEEIVGTFEKQTKAKVEMAYYEDAATEIGRLSRKPTGDLFIADLDATLTAAERAGIALHVRKVLYHKRLSLAVQKGNPKMIFPLSDLARRGVKVGIARAGGSHLGNLTRKALSRARLWEKVRRNAVAQVASPKDLAALILDKKADAVVCWDTLELLDLERIVVMRLPWRVCESKAVPAAVLGASQDKKLATRLLDLLASAQARHVLSKHAYWPGSGEFGGSGMDRVARTRFAPMYPLLAKQIIEDYGAKGGNCVDIGGGPGQLAIELAKIGSMKVWNVDIEPQAIEIARKHAAEAEIPQEKLRSVVGDVHNIPFPDNFAELVVSRGSIFFWRDQARGLREIHRILKPGGVAYVGGGFSRYLTTEQIVKMKPSWGKRGKGRPPSFNWDPAVAAKAAGIKNFKIDTVNGRWIQFRK
jgi:ABC-type molybdate transport system substrate-binding protein